MRKQILFAHSGGTQNGPGMGSYDFVKWLRESLGDQYEISYPIIEDPEAPTFEMWETMLDQQLVQKNHPVMLIGHSLGGSMLLKYLSEQESDFNITGLFLVATPYWGKGGWNVDDFKLKKDSSKHLPSLSELHFFHCSNDPIVPFEHLNSYKQDFPNAMVHELQCNSHVFADGLPELVEIIKNLNHN